MSRTRRQFSAEFKAKVALEAIREQRTLNEIASEYGVHPNLVREWKKQVLSEMPAIFTSTKESDAQERETEKERLFQQIGQLQYELAWLKKKAGVER